MLTPEKLLAIAIVEEEALAAGTTTSWCAERRMILLPSSVRVYVAVEPVRMNKSFEGLSNIVRPVVGQDPLLNDINALEYLADVLPAPRTAVFPRARPAGADAARVAARANRRRALPTRVYNTPPRGRT